eukprot:CAMPEP_0113938520 /NCGR_PEP_ID=MMETSP1339-20121228/4955_1 /TAXON_ID=94617 /ORGANISM="Fibrocapsa japonica" /LENGTH=96 /DNA_ID=CAMNT_0000941681 /DNA_START=65 /DNA_END=352 /DNA_ORIENTATION=- /assembly_acc=CAM_ASM_000762
MAPRPSQENNALISDVSEADPVTERRENTGVHLVAVVDAKDQSEDPKANKEKRRSALRRLIQYARGETHLLLAACGALVVNSVTNLSFPAIMGKAI